MIIFQKFHEYTISLDLTYDIKSWRYNEKYWFFDCLLLEFTFITTHVFASFKTVSMCKNIFIGNYFLSLSSVTFCLFHQQKRHDTEFWVLIIWKKVVYDNKFVQNWIWNVMSLSQKIVQEFPAQLKTNHCYV